MSLKAYAPLGVPSAGLPPEARHDTLKELVNKLAWVLGSVYKKPYTNRTTPVRGLAITLAVAILDKQGFPEHLESAQ